jgi:dihydroorotate dehydrogenase electron transfer subunit
MTKRIDDFEIVENEKLTDDLFILELAGNQWLSDFMPGQFVQVRVDGSPETFLRRPISVHDVDYQKNTFRLLIQTAGKGTLRLSELMPGNSINLIYPLGNWFSDPLSGDHILLVGGGVGIAPLLFLGKRLKSIGYSPDWLFGFRNRERVPSLDIYRSIGRMFLTTEDGSSGEKGFVTDHSILSGNDYNRIYCCGPDPMMRAIAGYCKGKGIHCEVSLENLMACGFGICLCCIVDTVNGNICTCTEGPVFNINDLKW